MPPVIDVDDEGFADGAEKRGENGEIHSLPGHANEDEFKPKYDSDENERWETYACDPSARHECIQE